MFSTIKVIAFDADDTLWVNEPYFRTAEKAFCELLKEYVPEEECNQLLYKFEMQNFTSKDEGSLDLDSGRFKQNMVLEEAQPVSNVNVDILMTYPPPMSIV